MDYTTISDIDLVGLLQNEDEEAFVEIYNRYWKRVYFLAFKYTKSEEASKDIAQDVFLKLWINRNNLNKVFTVLGQWYVRHCDFKIVITVHIMKRCSS